MTLKKGWLEEQIRSTSEQVQNWPAWMQREANRDYSPKADEARSETPVKKEQSSGSNSPSE